MYQASFQVADALAQPFPDGQFDLVWSMESGEHMPDKAKVFSCTKFTFSPYSPVVIIAVSLETCSIFVHSLPLFSNLQFADELVRVAAPGATIILVTWCHRDLGPSEQSLKPDEKKLLDKICNAFYLPAWCSTADYLKLLESYSLEVITWQHLSSHRIKSLGNEPHLFKGQQLGVSTSTGI